MCLKWVAVFIDFAYPALIFLLVSLTSFSFSPLLLEPLLMITTDFIDNAVGYFSCYFSLICFWLLVLTPICMDFQPWPLWCWLALFSSYLTEAPWVSSFPSHSLNHCHHLAWVWISVCYKKLFNVNFIFKPEPIEALSTKFCGLFLLCVVKSQRRLSNIPVCALPCTRRKREWGPREGLTLCTFCVPAVC